MVVIDQDIKEYIQNNSVAILNQESKLIWTSPENVTKCDEF